MTEPSTDLVNADGLITREQFRRLADLVLATRLGCQLCLRRSVRKQHSRSPDILFEFVCEQVLILPHVPTCLAAPRRMQGGDDEGDNASLLRFGDTLGRLGDVFGCVQRWCSCAIPLVRKTRR